MSSENKRIIIRAKDIMIVTGLSRRTAYKILSDVRKVNQKPKRSLVTVQEFCLFTGIKEAQVEKCMIS
jgi:predicted DNA-binding transcriptional regulator AlpA